MPGPWQVFVLLFHKISVAEGGACAAQWQGRRARKAEL